MRLIDADALAKFIDYGHLNNPNEKLYSENDIREMIDMMPTIEARKTGTWESINGNVFACSECGFVIFGREEIRDFCPSCGADMRGESDE